MPRGHHKNTGNNHQGNMTSTEYSYLTLSNPEHSNTAEAQEKDLKYNFMKVSEVSNKEMNKLLQGSQKHKNEQLEEINKSLKERQEKTNS